MKLPDGFSMSLSDRGERSPQMVTMDVKFTPPTSIVSMDILLRPSDIVTARIVFDDETEAIYEVGGSLELSLLRRIGEDDAL